MRPVFAILLVFLALPLVPPQVALAATLVDADSHVHIENFAFGPDSVTIDVGDAITWHNHDSFSHTATADGGEFDSGTLAQGDTFSHTFDHAGTFVYHCNIHTSMSGTITVGSTGSPPSVAIDSPAEGASVTGAFTAAGTASDADGPIALVEVSLDGGAFFPADGAESWTAALDASGLADGAHTLAARASDGAQLSPIVTRGFVVENPPLVPRVSITSPAMGAVLNGSVTFTGRSAETGGDIVTVEYAVDGGAFASTIGVLAWSADLDTRELANGLHTFEARATDAAGVVATASVSFRVLNLADLKLNGGELTTVGTLTSQTLHALVRNGGTVQSGPFAVRFTYAYHGVDHLIGETNVGSIPAGGSLDVTYTWSTIGKLGDFPVTALVDVNGTVEESNESNNAGSTIAAILVHTAPIDVTSP